MMSAPRRDEVRDRRERKHPLDYAIFIFLVATTVATGLAAYFTYGQWTTARDTLVVSERAFVYLAGVNSLVTKDPDPKKGEFLTVFTTLTNGGNTRTTGLELWVRCATSATKLVEPWGLLHQETEEHEPLVVAPKSNVPVPCSFKKSDVGDMADGRLFGYLMGDIRYRDIFEPNNRHVTQFSLAVTVNKYTEGSPFVVESQVSPIGKHNCADEDCPP
jgi:hypothetical protein